MAAEKGVIKDPSLFSITWSLFIEISLHMSLGILATLILSHYSDNAVAGVGVSNQVLNLFILVFNVTAVGTTILVGQSIGAERIDRARRLSKSSFGVNFWVGIIITVFVFVFGEMLLRFYGLEGAVHIYALTFLKITSISLFLEALSLVLGSILRSYGYTKETMVVTVLMNLISVTGNYISVTGAFGFPVTGVTGVAWSIVIARLFAVLALMILVYKILALKFEVKDVFNIPLQDVRDILSIGLPSAGENLSYHISQIVITGFVATLGAAALSARVYILNISMVCFLFSTAIAQGTQLLVARYIGSRQFDRAFKRGMRTLKLAMIVSFAVSLFIALIGRPY